MTTVLLGLLLFAVAMGLMAIGVILGGRELKGSCGGVAGKDCLCSIEEQRACAAAKRLARGDSAAG